MTTNDADRVEPAWIMAQRDAGWPDMHPEDFCHRCGAKNPLWFTDRETWLTATSAWAAETGREGICCPRCLAEMFHAATGDSPVWDFRPHVPAAQPVQQPNRDAAIEALMREYPAWGRALNTAIADAVLAALAVPATDEEIIEERIRKAQHEAWEECTRRFIELNPGLTVVPEVTP